MKRSLSTRDITIIAFNLDDNPESDDDDIDPLCTLVTRKLTLKPKG